MSDASDNEIEGFLRAHGPFEKPPAFAHGDSVGEWTIRAFLGRGGSAEVYRAVNMTTGLVVALKVLYKADDRTRERFRRETRLVAEMRSPAFPKFFGAGCADGRLYIAEELLEPMPLPKGDAAVARFVLDVAAGVEELHRRGFIHRDIKPSNVMMRPATGESVLIDMGLARESDNDASPPRNDTVSVVDGQAVGVGTPGFSAPEQFAGGKIGPTTDIHALGMLANRCFDGKPPSAWTKIIRRSTSSIPEQRYATVAEFMRAICHRHSARRILFVISILGAAALGAFIWATSINGGDYWIRQSWLAGRQLRSITTNEEVSVTTNEEVPVTTNEEASVTTNEEVSVATNEEVPVTTNEEVSVTINEEISVTTNEEASVAINEEVSVATNEEASVTTNEETSVPTNEEASVTTNEAVQQIIQCASNETPGMTARIVEDMPVKTNEIPKVDMPHEPVAQSSDGTSVTNVKQRTQLNRTNIQNAMGEAILEATCNMYLDGLQSGTPYASGSMNTNEVVTVKRLFELGKRRFVYGESVMCIDLKGRDLSIAEEVKLGGKQRIEIIGPGRLTASITGTSDVTLELKGHAALINLTTVPYPESSMKYFLCGACYLNFKNLDGPSDKRLRNVGIDTLGNKGKPSFRFRGPDSYEEVRREDKKKALELLRKGIYPSI